MEFPDIDTESASDEALLSTLCAIDVEFPCTGRYLRSGAHRRQVVAASLAPTIKARGEDKKLALARLGAVSPNLETGLLLAAAGQAICEERGADLIRRSYGNCPHGFIGALERSGSTAHNKGFYLDLFSVFNLPQHRKLAITLQYQPLLHPRLVRTALRLPPYLCTGSFLHAACRTNVDELLAAVQIIKEICPSATDDALRDSIETGGDISVHAWLARWASRASLPPAPISDDDLLVSLKTVAEMETLGRQMRNCLRSKAVSALALKTSYFHARIADASYVVELVNNESAWKIGGIYGSRNHKVPAEIKSALAARLEARGLSFEYSEERGSDRWEPIRNALRHAPLTEEDHYLPDWME